MECLNFANWMFMYDEKTQETTDGCKRKTDSVGHTHGKQYPLHLRIGHGNQLYAWTMGKGSRQRIDLQDDFTRFLYSYWRHDWVPVWYQTHAK